ncbi:MAG: hypothetical protein GXP63_02845 [DPANN group archaeon]|nr:hypothetical protein [DPANN group archaeon]
MGKQQPKKDEVKEQVEELVLKYRKRLDDRIAKKPEESWIDEISTTEYDQFKQDILPAKFTYYEKACNIAEKILQVKPDKKKAALIQESIDVTHLNITPAGVTSFSILLPLLVVIFGSLITYALFQSSFFIFIMVITGLVLMMVFGKLPQMFANNWRMSASNQMVLAVFYIVTYMRHTSNLENALNFASQHISGPLALDFRKILWDVETEKYESIKESLDLYLESWRKWNMEFIEAIHLVESSLYESGNDRRLTLLDKALDVILTETYEKMLHYAQNLKSPITMLHMLGIILPILGLVILPMVVSFMDGIRWYHLATLYNVILPISVFYMGKNILARRPTGYGDVDISEYIPGLKDKKKIQVRIGGFTLLVSPIYLSAGILLVMGIIGLTPVILHTIGMEHAEFFGADLLGYRISKTTGKEIGPYGLGASILSIAIPLAFGIAIGIYYKLTSKNVLKIRDKAKKLENEFASALFQMGNRLGDGIPVEVAFGKVAKIMEGTVSGEFFSEVDGKIRRGGMNVDRAIFDEEHGALKDFPSNIIESSMKVLIESAKKGPRIAAQALLNIARYIKEIHRVNERLKDLLADVISSMKSQITFLTPVIAGIVIGITSMVMTILGKLGEQIKTAQVGAAGGGAIAGGGLGNLFGDGIPTYYFQIIVGLYVVQIVYILTILANGIENGSDKLNERFLIGRNMMRSPLTYAIIATVIMVIFNTIATKILPSAIG